MRFQKKLRLLSIISLGVALVPESTNEITLEENRYGLCASPQQCVCRHQVYVTICCRTTNCSISALEGNGIKFTLNFVFELELGQVNKVIARD